MDDTAQRSPRLLLLPIRNETYAVALTRVVEVIPSPQVTPLPTTDRRLRGVFNTRGAILPLFDAAEALGAGPLSEAVYAVVIEAARGRFGVATSAVPEVVDVPAAAPSATDDGHLVYVLEGGRVASELDLEALVADLAVP